MNLLARLFLVAIALVATAAGYADPRAAAQFTDTETLAALSDSHPVALLPLNKAEPRQVPQYSQLSTAAENGLVFGNATSLMLGGNNTTADLLYPGASARAATPTYRPAGPLPVSAATAGAYRTVSMKGYPARVPAMASGSRSPEPSGWTLLLCSFLVVGFIAQRRSRLVGG